MPPVNDDLAGRTDLGSIGTASPAGTTVGATAEAWEVADGYTPPSVWYEFTATDPAFVLDGIVADYLVYGEIHHIDNDPPASFSDLTYLAYFGDGTTSPPGLALTLTPGDKYVVYISNWNFDTEEGTFSFNVYDPVPANDDIADARVIPGGGGTVAGDNTGYTLETNEAALWAAGGGFGGGLTAWYKWTAPDDGQATFQTSSNGSPAISDSTMLVIDGDDFTTAAVLGFDDDSGPGSYSQITIAVVGGATYWIGVDGYAAGNHGKFKISATFTAIPCNDTYPSNLGGAPDFDAVCYAVEGGDGFSRGFKSGGCHASSTKNATAEAGEPDPAPGFAATHSVWLTLWANFTGTVRAWLTSTDPNMADGIMSVYDWTYLDPVTALPAPLDQGDSELGTQPQVVFAVVENNRYVFQIDTRDSGGHFTFHWERSDGTPPANDDFANAEVITGIGGETDGTTTTATAECGEPGQGGDPLDGPYNTVWYKWVAPETCTAIIKVAGKGTYGYSHPHNVNVFTGASLTGLTIVPTGTSILGVSWAMTAGVTYYVRVDNGEADPPGPYDPAGTPDDFTLFWETDSLDWRMRAGTFTAGDTHIDTGLGDQVTAVILYFGGVPDGVYTDTGYMVGAGAADGTDQWAVGMAYPRNSVHGIPLFDTSLNGNQYHQTRFSQTAAISVPGLLGGVYAEATVVSLNADGSFDLSWGTDPGDGSLCGFVALSGVEAAAGSFTYSNGAPGTEVVVPGFRTRAFMIGSTGTAPGGIPDPGSTPAGYVQAGCWNEGVPAQAYYGSDAYGAQIESGIGWYGGNSYDGLFLNSGSVGQLFFQSAGGVGEIGGIDALVVGALSFDIHHEDPAFSGGTGWLALGGYGWHTSRTPTMPTLLADFWTQAALAYGGGYLNYGAFDELDSQFDMTEWANDCQTNPYPDLSFATPTSRTAHTGRIQTQLDPASGYSAEENYVESGHVTVAVTPGVLNNVVVTSVGGAGAELVLFGNYLPPAPPPVIVRRQQIVRYK